MEVLIRFCDAARQDNRLGTAHISLFLALFRLYLRHDYTDPVELVRAEVMSLARIYGIATYHKCIRELDAYGYIRYVPARKPGMRSRVYMREVHMPDDRIQDGND